MDIDKSLLEDIQLVPEKFSMIIEKYEAKIQKIMTEGKILKNELEAKYEVKIAELMRAMEQLKDTLEGDHLVHEELLVEVNSKCVDLENKLADLQIKFDESTAQASELAAELAENKELALSYKSRYEAVNSELEVTVSDKAQIESALAECRDTLSSLREQLNGLIAEKASLESTVDANTRELTKLEDVVDKLNVENAGLSVHLEEATERANHFSAAVDSLTSEKQALDLELSDLSIRHEDCMKRIEENSKTLAQVLAENSSLKAQLDAINGVSSRNRKLIDEHLKRGFDDRKLGEREESAALKLIEANKQLEILKAENEELRKSISEAKKIRLDFEKEKMRIKMETETEARKRVAALTSLAPSASAPAISPALVTKAEQEIPVTREIRTTEAIKPSSDEEKKERRKSLPRQYFAEDQPFTKDLVNERVAAFVVEDMLSIEALSHAIVNKILRESPDKRLCYVCKDISKKKCEYITKGNKWIRDKNMGYLKECLTPALVKISNKFIGEERIADAPRDGVVADLLSLIQKLKNDKTFFEALKNHLVPSISY